MYASGDNVTYFDSLGLEYVKKFIANKNIYKTQENEPIMCGYFCIGFIDFVLEGRKLLFYPNSFFLTNMTKQ